MTTVSPTTKDISRAIARLDEHATTAEGDVINIDGENWTGLDLRLSVVICLGSTIGSNVRLRKITKRDMSIMLAAHGASTFTIRQHANALARLLRHDQSLGRMGAWI